MWPQVTYPDLFRGEWSISPDPVDFRDFTGPDLTQNPRQNFYYDAMWHRYVDYIVREAGAASGRALSI